MAHFPEKHRVSQNHRTTISYLAAPPCPRRHFHCAVVGRGLPLNLTKIQLSTTSTQAPPTITIRTRRSLTHLHRRRCCPVVFGLVSPASFHLANALCINPSFSRCFTQNRFTRIRITCN